MSSAPSIITAPISVQSHPTLKPLHPEHVENVPSTTSNGLMPPFN